MDFTQRERHRAVPEDDSDVFSWLSDLSSKINIDLNEVYDNNSRVSNELRPRNHLMVPTRTMKKGGGGDDSLQAARQALQEYRGTSSHSSLSNINDNIDKSNVQVSRWDQLKEKAAKRSAREHVSLAGEIDKVSEEQRPTYHTFII